MFRPKILLADNVESFTNTCAEYLEMHGYQVQKETTPESCLKALQEGSVHLAIFDLRMLNDKDDKDVSGLRLARQSNPLIPKIILTAYPTWTTAREALSVEHELPPAVYFLDKREGLTVLLEHVKRAFDRHVRINGDLQIEWRARDRFSLVKLIEPELEDQSLASRADEFEDLFRRLFPRPDQIRIDDLVWQRPGRLALKVFAFAKERMPESMLLVCGRNAEVKDEKSRYQDHSPKSPKANATTLHLSAETTHFAANAYALAGCDFESARSLRELYRTDTGKIFNSVITTLYEQTLADWSQEKLLTEDAQTLDELYRDRLGLTPTQIDQSAVVARVESLIRKLPVLGMGVELNDGQLTLRFNGVYFSYPEPTRLLNPASSVGSPVLLVNTPGLLTGENILTDRSDQVWLTDFGEAGLSPLFWNYVTLEAAIRFDWVEINQPQRMREFEHCLIEGDFSRFDQRDLEPPLHKPLRAIQAIRRLAARHAGQDLLSYHLGVFFHAVWRLIGAPLPSHPTNNELARLGRLLISASMISGLISQAQPPANRQSESKPQGIRIDRENYEVWVEGRRVRLSERGFKLFSFFHDRANQLCTRRDIVEHVFGYAYDEENESQEDLVNTAISRLRAEIEPDPQRPRYLRNERGRGYRLALDLPASARY
jgi:DNA-binding response OmpR family regulator